MTCLGSNFSSGSPGWFLQFNFLWQIGPISQWILTEEIRLCELNTVYFATDCGKPFVLLSKGLQKAKRTSLASRYGMLEPASHPTLTVIQSARPFPSGWYCSNFSLQAWPHFFFFFSSTNQVVELPIILKRRWSLIENNKRENKLQSIKATKLNPTQLNSNPDASHPYLPIGRRPPTQWPNRTAHSTCPKRKLHLHFCPSQPV